MAYTTFSTENADYVLQLGNHAFNNKHKKSIFEGIDAMVLETGVDDFNPLTMYYCSLHPQFFQPVRHCEEERIPVYLLDPLHSSVVGVFRDCLNSYIYLPLIPLELFYGFTTGKIPTVVSRIHNLFDIVFQCSVLEGRNSVIAKKVEEYIVPQLLETKKKPRIGMVFGAGHMSLENCLKSKRRRDFTLWNWRNFNFSKWHGFDKKRLDIVYEAYYNGIEWQGREYETELFK